MHIIPVLLYFTLSERLQVLLFEQNVVMKDRWVTIYSANSVNTRTRTTLAEHMSKALMLLMFSSAQTLVSADVREVRHASD